MITILSSDGADDLHDKQVFNNLLRGKVGEDTACASTGSKCATYEGQFVPCCTGSCSGKTYNCVQMIVIVKEGVLSCLFSSLRCLAVVTWFDRRNEWQINIEKSCCFSTMISYSILNLISRIIIICPIDRIAFSFWQICHCHDSPPLITAIIGSTTYH